MTEKRSEKWFTAIPMKFREVPEFWQRDAGLVCLGFRHLGVDSKFVALGEPAMRSDLPLVLATEAQMRDSSWWASFKLDGVVLWASGYQNESISRAIRAAGPKTVIHMDTDGLCSPRVAFWPFFIRSYQEFRDRGRRPAPLLAAAKSCLYHIFPGLCDAPQIRHIANADLITINSPLARERFRRFLRILGRPDLVNRVRLVPSPLCLDMDIDPSTGKKKQIVAAGRWEAYQKDYHRTMKVVEKVLELQPDYSVVLLGSGHELLARFRAQMPEALQTRIRIAGYVDRLTLVRTYQESQIMYVGSRYESLNLAAVEALACGCSVVGPAGITSINYMTSASSGSLAASRSIADLTDALNAEIDAWRMGERNPIETSRHWRAQFTAPKYAARVLNFFQHGPVAEQLS